MWLLIRSNTYDTYLHNSSFIYIYISKLWIAFCFCLQYGQSSPASGVHINCAVIKSVKNYCEFNSKRL